MKTVLYLGAIEGFEAAQGILKGVAAVHHGTAETDDVTEALKQVHALLDASMKVSITNDMITGATWLRLISCATTGSDHIQRDVLYTRNIPVFTLKDDPELLRNITPAAELSWALLMACARGLPAATRHVTDGGWTRELFPGIMLNGKRLGLIGCGRIGGWMARYGLAFGMDVVGYDPHLRKWPDTIRKTPLDELMQTSDFISIHVHLGPETEGLVSRSLLEKAKPGLILINTSRGAVLDESALLDGLKSGRIHAAGLDVLTGEPDIGRHPLVEFARTSDRMLITPHCGGFSPDAVRLVCAHAAKKIRDFLNAETLPNES